MAEGLLKYKLSTLNKSECKVSSAGLNALVGYKPDPLACKLMLKKGIDISGHRACRLTTEMVTKADLILVMESYQKSILAENNPSLQGKIFRLGEWGKFDISDPYQKELPAFEKSLELIEKGVSEWTEKLCV
ncbi:MAG: low molecular weight phosphotyrosine protein phosphatase [Nitrosomonas sp.]|nr:low molecular weight phosphotyrosine protein phosphatase [Nitrosomonas sp.]MCW5607146.1 low molecular weight phosphotyrosine protein phosphatase [Nitrosomonas sp.]